MALALLLAIPAILACLFALQCLFPAKALAWDPNSHDKLTNFALDLLAGKGRNCLLGWILARSGWLDFLSPDAAAVPPSPLNLAVGMQTRRGSVEEDMNSYLISHLIYKMGIADSLEGANGGYHFYCPKRDQGQGLSDTTVFLNWLGAKGSGCVPPMPSALVRATSRETGVYDLGHESRDWHLDSEKRNYTYDDALEYYRKGYSHLAFYAIGRVCHLLQDMAVPAHVRDDAHVGGKPQDYGFDPSDPMERFAEENDRPKPFASEPGEANYYNELWSFSPLRQYTHDSIFSNSAEQYSKNNYTIEKAFHSLALNTYNAWFSYNTIPQNVDSHDPITTLSKPYSLHITADEMGKRCDIETDALWSVLRRLTDNARILYDPERIPAQISPPEGFKSKLVIARGVSETLEAIALRSKQTVSLDNGPLVNTVQIIGIGCRLAPLDNESVLDILRNIAVWRADAAMIFGQLAAQETATGTPTDEPYSEAAQELVEAYDDLLLEQLLGIFAENTNLDLGTILKRWIFTSGVSFRTLRKWFWTETAQQQQQGPFCLTEEIILRQYRRQQDMAVRATADMLATWFESVFNQEYPPLAVWLNANAASCEEKPALAPVRPVASSVATSKWATLALINHLPVSLDLSLEISLIEEETDKELWEKGVRLNVDWDLLLARDLNAPAAEEQPSVARAVREFLDTQPCRELASSFSLVLDGKHEPSATLQRFLVPYNLEALIRLALPSGAWSPECTDMGGVSREYEESLLPPLAHDKKDAPGLDRITTSILRIRPIGPADIAAADAP